jgi:hypothetical protein
MSAQTATARRPAKPAVPIKLSATNDVFDRIKNFARNRTREKEAQRLFIPTKQLRAGAANRNWFLCLRPSGHIPIILFSGQASYLEVRIGLFPSVRGILKIAAKSPP